MPTRKVVAKKAAPKKTTVSTDPRQEEKIKDLMALTDKIVYLIKQKPLVEEVKELRTKLDESYAENMRLQRKIEVPGPSPSTSNECLRSTVDPTPLTEGTLNSTIQLQSDLIKGITDMICEITSPIYRLTGKSVEVYQSLPINKEEPASLLSTMMSHNTSLQWQYDKLKEIYHRLNDQV
jgi:hypothetical protein